MTAALRPSAWGWREQYERLLDALGVPRNLTQT